MWKCPVCGADNEFEFCSGCGNAKPAQSQDSTQYTYQPMPDAYAPMPKKSKKPLIIGLCAAGAVVVVVIVLLFVFLGGKGPYSTLLSAAKKTVAAGSVKVKTEQYSEELSLKMAWSLEDEHLNYDTTDSDGNRTVYYNGKGFSTYGSNTYYYNSSSNDEVVEMYNKFIGNNPDDLLDILEDEFNIDVDTLEDYGVDIEIFKGCIKDLMKKLDDTAWVTKNMGLTIKNVGGETKYEFDIDIEDLLEAVLEVFKPALTDDFYDELKDEIANDDSVEFTITLKDGYISGFEMDRTSVSLSNFGKEPFDDDEYTELLADAKKKSSSNSSYYGY